MRDSCSPLSYMLDKYQQNLYLDHHHQAHSFHSGNRKQLHHAPSFPSGYPHHYDGGSDEDDDRISLHSHSSITSTHSLPIGRKHSSSRISSYSDHHNGGSTVSFFGSPTKSEISRCTTNSSHYQHNSTSTIKPRNVKYLKDYMRRNRLRMVEATANGNCLFNSISLALFDSEHKNYQLRKLCVDWIEENLETKVKDGIKIRDLIFLKPEHSSIAEYLHDLRQEKEWADYCCLNALSNLLECELEVVYVNYEDGVWLVKSEIQVEPITKSTTLPKIQLMYIEELKHYNLLIKCK